MTDVVHVIKANTPPASAPLRAGQHWVDMALKKTYISVGIDTVDDWVELSQATLAKNKAGRLLNSDFSGSPKTATVTFAEDLATPYAVNVTGVDARSWSIESKTSSGFTVNTNANMALTGDVFWEVQENGEF